MEHFCGKILQEGRVLLDQVSGSFYLRAESDPHPWDGHFVVPPGKFLPPGPYRLVLDDGRSGDILIDRVSVTGRYGTAVGFVGVGALA